MAILKFLTTTPPGSHIITSNEDFAKMNKVKALIAHRDKDFVTYLIIV